MILTTDAPFSAKATKGTALIVTNAETHPGFIRVIRGKHFPLRVLRDLCVK
jgi:hypothetical protein